MSTAADPRAAELLERFALKAFIEGCLLLEEGVASMKDIDLERGLKLVGDKKVLSGKFNGDLALDAKGQDPDLLKKTLAGIVQGHIADGAEEVTGRELRGLVDLAR